MGTTEIQSYDDPGWWFLDLKSGLSFQRGVEVYLQLIHVLSLSYRSPSLFSQCVP